MGWDMLGKLGLVDEVGEIFLLNLSPDDNLYYLFCEKIFYLCAYHIQ